MIEIFLKTLPFFALIGVGYIAARRGFFPPVATEYLTRFVFYFALSAMIFRFTAGISLASIFKWNFIFAYLSAGTVVYLLATAVAYRRTHSFAEAAVEAQCAVVGNVGFLGLPMLALLLGTASVGPVMMVLIIDLFVFGNLFVMLISASRGVGADKSMFHTIVKGLVKNPMIISLVLGMIWSAFSLPVPAPADEFLELLSGAATPGALFAIGASLAAKSAERITVASWLTVCKLVLHPGAVAFFAYVVFDVEPYAAAVMVAASSLPVAGNVYILAQHYGVAPQRVSTSIFVSTVVSVVSVSIVISLVSANIGL